MFERLRSYVPNLITFISLACGVLAILLSFKGNLYLAGILIIGSAFLDGLDGFSARHLNVQSNLGLQLDSLVDMVSLCIAPIVITFLHLSRRGFTSYWLILPFIFLAWAGAFRLARFNLLPQKSSSNSDSLGLTIGQAGVTLVLAVLSDHSFDKFTIPIWQHIGLILVLSILMASKITFPSLTWFFPSRIQTLTIFLSGAIFMLFLPPTTTLLIFCMGILVISVIRALYKGLNHQSSIS